MVNKKKDLKLEITELFMAKAGKTGWNRCFYGTIKRNTNKDGSEFVVGKIPVNDYIIFASANNYIELGENLDDLVVLVLDYNLNSMSGVFENFLNLKYSLN